MNGQRPILTKRQETWELWKGQMGLGKVISSGRPSPSQAKMDHKIGSGGKECQPHALPPVTVEVTD